MTNTARQLNDQLDHPVINAIYDKLLPQSLTVLSGAWGSIGHLIMGRLALRTGRCVLGVVAHLDDADECVEDIGLLGNLRTALFPALEVLPGETETDPELLAERLSLAESLQDGQRPDIIISSIQALMQSIPESSDVQQMYRQLEVGDEVDPNELMHWMDRCGYVRVEAVDDSGQYAMRGGILDIYPPGNQVPARMDFFGDEIDDIHEIDLDTMGSTRNLRSIKLIGASLDQLQSSESTTSLWSRLPQDTIVVSLEMMEIDEQARGYIERVTNPRGLFLPQGVYKGLFPFTNVQINQFSQNASDHHVYPLPIAQPPRMEQDALKIAEQVLELQSEHEITVYCEKEAEKERLTELLEQMSVETGIPSKVNICEGYLYRGFIWNIGDSANVNQPAHLIMPHHELFGRFQTRRRIRKVSSGQSTEQFFDLEIGDYVVHTDHGIALFKGLKQLKRDEEGISEEYMTLEFANRSLLHVPTAQVDKVQKYIGGFAGKPKLSVLGGKRWDKQKEQVKEAVRDLARELLQVQAARQSLSGISYPDDSLWMRRFEEEFPYQETDDQLTAIQSLKKDMIGRMPMDRLICGDVGYGKTEVAMRAAFKAADAGKQVAVLCPTTVLCEQHERSFRQRMADYPLKVEAIHRFKSPAACKLILEQVSEGKVDILIGTHRILSEDVLFKDLGLVVVDEEQKFGVEHKNRLMRFRMTVEVLTLTATPIPRTLHMALMGIKSISSLTTAPADRRAVVTEVIPKDKERIRKAILREISREGQCFFVHNRVKSIHRIANELRALVPEASFIVGHGQMPGRELEGVMHKFINRQVDVLVSTTIIESGIDIPTANTMFIDQADMFGLAELHQLRGRVGRYKHRAYCYLLLPENRPLSEVAAKRLRAIEEFSMLGAGFKIAMRDMEIRGVGNILGPQQSGHIAAVGYEMYCQLLDEQIRGMQGKAPKLDTHTHLELKINGGIPQHYINSQKLRMSVYRRIAQASDLHAITQLEKDLTDAYGKPPKATMRLLELAEIRIGLAINQVKALKLDQQDLIFSSLNVKQLYEKLEKAPGSVRVVKSPQGNQPGEVYWRPPSAYLELQTLPAVLRKLFTRDQNSK